MTGPPDHEPPVPPRTVATGDVTLAVWDTGGAGPPVVLMHAAWGSGEHWAPQLRALHAAGYRPIAWSRRGHHGSDAGPADPGEVSTDLERLAAALALTSFHLVGTGFGGAGAVQFALTRPSRVRSLTLAASLCGVTDPAFVAETRRLVPPAWERLPIELRELSAAYRFRDVEGTHAWCRLTKRAVHRRVSQRPAVEVTRAALADLSPPTLLLTGAADPYLPPPRMHALAAEIPGAGQAVIAEAGHSPSWENPAEFDETVLDHLSRHTE
ncbi:alpha/beta fold hydrolase [Actinophytocola sp.]|uniref:alpha/beta fold hydrolase n=1 Tax=Actinophytocola sp. TaxID=1872138 RepID=UPI00389AF670